MVNIKSTVSLMRKFTKFSRNSIEWDKMSKLKDHVVPICVGFAGGCLGSLVGLGGGFIMIPLLTKYGGFTQIQSTSTSLTAVIGTSLSAGYNYYKSNNVDVLASLTIASSAILLSVFGAHFTSRFSQKILKRSFGILSIIIAPTVPLKDYLFKHRHVDNNSNNNNKDSLFYTKLYQLLSVGSLTGFVSGFFGVGGGGIATPLLCYLSTYNQQKVLGTTILSMFPSAITASITHFRLGNIVIRYVPSLIIGSVIGSYLGSTIACKLPEKELKYLFSVVLIISGVKMLK